LRQARNAQCPAGFSCRKPTGSFGARELIAAIGDAADDDRPPVTRSLTTLVLSARMRSALSGGEPDRVIVPALPLLADIRLTERKATLNRAADAAGHCWRSLQRCGAFSLRAAAGDEGGCPDSALSLRQRHSW
jgi:hypothetical protein